MTSGYYVPVHQEAEHGDPENEKDALPRCGQQMCRARM